MRILSLKKRRPRCNGGQPGRKAFDDDLGWQTSVADVVQGDGVLGRCLDEFVGTLLPGANNEFRFQYLPLQILRVRAGSLGNSHLQ